MFSCDWAVKEAEKLVTTCYKYQAYFPTFSEEKQELLNLANQIINNKPAFTAAGFFEVNCRTLFTLFGTTTTYFIVIIQFNQM
ncbi:putative gustatory receptor 2a [Anoplophora glabripennis]|uniref:putative gustatory receptor 2a n=1 Tax=Anoplophora glabripennis TaxID=217634 RepID=UPI000C7655FD|nr:putative gustatory receptor 2a [Anoplophora glabripennis]XP_023313219.1 putative gustatory receptor 2a [Anoplophora glabripennis]